MPDPYGPMADWPSLGGFGPGYVLYSRDPWAPVRDVMHGHVGKHGPGSFFPRVFPVPHGAGAMLAPGVPGAVAVRLESGMGDELVGCCWS